ncbi:hypothetical protein QTI66_16800 [Variovorax sp. J22R133]|uniref:hypothetical protein n=1 Tax=Variovorax brevis TaxID=3053503 RepID=UPI00257795D7|nr:hypothetical protein [Variovorax sp. J22R133]MDM0113821.1 hypothetical protein [Variovorax sp. J22R133]
MSAHLAIALLVDAVIAITLIECAALWLLRRPTAQAPAARGLWATLASGLCLMFALHCAVRGSDAVWIALFLFAAGVAHATDLWLRRSAARKEAAIRPS